MADDIITVDIPQLVKKGVVPQDATATPEYVLKGLTFYAGDNEKKTGTLDLSVINVLANLSFVKIGWKEGTNNILEFRNLSDQSVQEIELSPFVQEQADLAVDDATLETFVKNKSTRYLLNEGEDGTSKYATEKYVEENGGKIDSISVNSENIEIKDKNVNIIIPTKLSEFENDSEFIKNTVDNLINYYTKTETYSKDEINNLVNTKFSALIVSTLPTENISTSIIYLIAKQGENGNDYYDEYLYINNAWELIGNTKLDITFGTAPGNVPVIGEDGKLPAEILPEVGGGQVIYDLVITNQEEFDAWVETLAAGTCEAHSVLLVGDGGSTAFTTRNSIQLPDTLFSIEGINNAIINITYSNYGISYASQKKDVKYSIKNITLNCSSSAMYYGLSNFGRVENCKVISSNLDGYKKHFVNCFNLENCSAELSAWRVTEDYIVFVMYEGCENLINCSFTFSISGTYGYSRKFTGFKNCKNLLNPVATIGELYCTDYSSSTKVLHQLYNYDSCDNIISPKISYTEGDFSDVSNVSSYVNCTNIITAPPSAETTASNIKSNAVASSAGSQSTYARADHIHPFSTAETFAEDERVKSEDTENYGIIIHQKQLDDAIYTSITEVLNTEV